MWLLPRNIFLSYFFLLLKVPLRVLISFPTRRSSDLVTALRLEEAGAVAVMPLASPIGSGLGMLNQYAIRIIKRRLEVPRSEEHTSELQSLRHLVCRLLLEKKKI